MPKNKIKIELELNQDLIQKIEIIANAFNWTPEQFIEFSLKQDIKYVNDTIERNDFEDLQLEYGPQINIEKLKKIIITQEIKPMINIEIPKKLYKDLEKLCKINNVDTYEKIIKILEETVDSAEITEESGSKHVYNF